MSKRFIHVSVPGQKSHVIEVAPNAEDIPSKRYPIIEAEDKKLGTTIQELDEGTKLKNQVFEERLDEIRGTTAAFEAKLRTEVSECLEQNNQLKKEYDSHAQAFKKSIAKLVNKTYDKFDKELYPALEKRVDELDTNMEVFIHKTVPENMERHTGEISRRLKKQYETFDIERQKEVKREAKLVAKASEHLQNTAQRFMDEEALRTARFFALEEEMTDRERRAVRNHDRHFDTICTTMEQGQALLLSEAETRRLADVNILDAIFETQGLLQQTVFQHFGSDSQAKEF